MKKIIHIMLALLLAVATVQAQGELYISPGATLYTTGSSSILTLQNAKLTNNGSLTASDGTVLIKGNGMDAQSSINGTGATAFKNLTVDKTAHGVQLNQNINVSGDLTLTSGGLVLANGSVNFLNSGNLQSETAVNNVSGIGHFRRIATLNAPASANPGNLGAVLTSALNLSTTTIYRAYNNVSASSVGRSYDIRFAAPGTTTVTLYFTQAEFDAYNALSAADLPTNDSDATGKAALRIKRYSTLSNTGTFAENTYSGTPTVIDPDDSNIVWNAAMGRWELTFNVSASGGFFVYTGGCTAPTITTAAGSNSPICAGEVLNLSVTAAGTEPLSYTWSGTGTFTNGNTATPSVMNAATGNYTVTVTNTCGMIMSTAAVVVNTPDAPTGLLAITNSTCSACALSGGSIAIGTVSGTGGTLEYSTDGGTTWSSTLPTYNQAGPAQTIIASVLAANGCRSNTTAVGATIPGTCTTPTVMITNNNGLNLDCNNPQTTLSATAATSYNWTRNGNPFGSTQQVSVTQAGTYAVTITAANGCTASSSVGVNFAPDTTLPGIDCPGAQTLILDGSCSAVLPNYTGMAVTSDNCGVQSVTQSPAAASTVSGASNMMVTLTVTDVNGLTNTCAFTVTKVDNTPPVITCVNTTIQFNGESSIALNASSLVTASDNCGIQGTSLSPASVSISQVNQTVPVMVTVTDNSGNATSCTAQVTVSGLPAGWSQNPNGIGCAGGNDVGYTNGVFSINSTGCYSAPPFTADAAGFAQQELCGNGSIIAQVTSLNGGGWAGITMRESDAAGARKVQLMTNRATFNRREVRSILGGQASLQQFSSQNKYWLRLLRQGNQFVGYTSSTGDPNWTQAFVVTLNGMPDCLDVGLVVTNNTAMGSTAATFANVTITTNPSLQAIETNDLGAEVVDLYLDIFPNPTSGEVTVDFTPWAGKPALLEVYDLQGRRVRRLDLDEATGPMPVDMSNLPSGVYLFRVGEVQQRVVLQR